ncbi:MAG: hypothetical protein JXB17_10295 [Bacteroidales bacterium]|nr:hypothetical protein [Bacteroidales bacterium]
MKKIDDIIKENKDLFNSEEPNHGHFERFFKKLEKQNKNHLIYSLYKYLKVAAVIILVILSSLYIYENLISTKNKIITLSDISPEYREAENYFITVVNSKYEQIKSFNFEDDKQKEILLKELDEMDSLYDSLQNDLQTTPNDERIINAMINYYQFKIEILNNIIEQLQNFNNYKTEKDESTEI